MHHLPRRDLASDPATPAEHGKSPRAETVNIAVR
jgi:hypothetical protein